MPEQMTPDKNRNRRAERSFQFEVRELNIENSEEKELWVEGRAVSFNSPTVLFEFEGIEYKEQIDDRAFQECNMSDVIFNYNHSGKVMARTRNNTLQLEVREDGLWIRARLDGTEEGQKLYQEIQGGYIDRMSFQFTIQEEAYDSVNHMWTVRKVKRLYDVSAVDIPAYNDTSIEARKNLLLEADAQEKRKREAAADLNRRILILRNKLTISQEKGEKE